MAVFPARAELRSAITISMEQFMMTAGTNWMLRWSVHKQVSLQMVISNDFSL